MSVGEIALFHGLPEKSLDDIARAGREIDHPPGSDIVREGGMGLGFHIVLDGKAVVTAGESEIARLGAGEFFGEMALLERAPRNATVSAGPEGVRTFSIDATDFRWLVDQHPAFAEAIARAVDARKR